VCKAGAVRVERTEWGGHEAVLVMFCGLCGVLVCFTKGKKKWQNWCLWECSSFMKEEKKGWKIAQKHLQSRTKQTKAGGGGGIM